MGMKRQRSTNYDANIRRQIRECDDVQKALSPFSETRRLFANYIGYTGPMSYEEWMQVDSDKKAAVLFVQFFDQITLAWYKVKSFYTPDEDGVSTMMQYLIKNVPIIEKNPTRFRPNYIYSVARNCLYCICHDIQRDRDRWELEVSNICPVGDDEVDLFDTVCDSDLIENIVTREHFWEAIEKLELSDEMMDFVYSLASSSSPMRLNDDKRHVIEQLKVVLAPYASVYLQK